MNRRNTIQRNMVLTAVRELGCHATADEVYNHIAKVHPSISKGTVYRNLNILADSGEIRRIEVPGAADCFDHICERHFHVKCIKCGKVFDVDAIDMPDLTGSIKDNHGFEFLDYDIVFKGICPECMNKEKGDAGHEDNAES